MIARSRQRSKLPGGHLVAGMHFVQDQVFADHLYGGGCLLCQEQFCIHLIVAEDTRSTNQISLAEALLSLRACILAMQQDPDDINVMIPPWQLLVINCWYRNERLCLC